MPPKSATPRRSARNRPAGEAGADSSTANDPNSSAAPQAATDSPSQDPSPSGPKSPSEPAHDASSSRAPAAEHPTNASPAPRTRTLKFQPKTNLRRTKEQREAQEQAEAARQQERAAAAAAAAEKAAASALVLSAGAHAQHQPPPARRPEDFSSRGGWRGRGRGGRGAFRGGLSGWRNESRGGGAAFGFLGGPSGEAGPVRKGRAGGEGVEITSAKTVELPKVKIPSSPVGKKSRATDAQARSASKLEETVGGRAGGSKGKGKAKKVQKQEPEVKAEFQEALDVGVEDEANRVNIDDLIYVSSDDDAVEEVPGEATPDRKLDRDSERPPAPGRMRPVRIGRREHVERTKGVSTDASSAKASELRRKASQREERAMGANTDDAGPPSGRRGKRKAKGKEVEFVRSQPRPKGPSGTDDSDVDVKQEDTDAAPASGHEQAGADEQHPDDEDEEISGPKGRRRRRRTTVFRASQPLAQTEEDIAELERHESDLNAVAEELGGPALVENHKDPSPSREADLTAQDRLKQSIDQKQDLVYLFQLPPFLPNLVPKAEREAAPAEAEVIDVERDHSPIPQNIAEQLAKEEADPLDEEPDQEGITANKKGKFSGRIGTLTIYDTGQASMTWGGIEHVLGRAPPNEMLQEVLVTDTDGKTSWSMGQVAGGFVVTPSWPALFDACD